MLIYPHIDPVALRIGPLAVHWYGLMYLLGFLGFWWFGSRRAAKPFINWPKERVSDLLFYGVVGVIVGGRVGYTLFYNLPVFLADPLSIFKIWEGGMSFHGGLIGVLVAFYWFGRNYQQSFFQVADFAAPMVPLGLFTGRIGNFINGELWGAPTTLPWGMVFPHAGLEPRHPSMLYEAGLEGLALFLILWFFAAKPRPRMAVSGLFLIGYGVFRTLVETVRLPDTQIGYLLGTEWLTMGMVLSAPMWLGGIALMVLAYRGPAAPAPTARAVKKTRPKGR
ncbi:prolipoprotein diacylglyceryl transferase [Sinimarinibacterium sp. NLF-5-8]|uniref:prolipoprotein diacylglyceryl transferase n=1 Tax=Sinimarinibacterium sp. NLF-5-8 TaxID=2698684 RepID=UPI00137BA03F|nr:prolipoprotein diacylglyceryl transferase [Sinimarinibacterium sp. NLF-5-8]QHS09998.1 prolipoprotein diacylglyceryl transferase [Sinimarinibacterium sp. NLF-5-8]